MSKPAEVSLAEQAAGSSEQVMQIISTYAAAVGLVNHTIRQLLPLFDGYECKEPEPGKFTLAFRCDAWVALEI